MLLAVCVTPVAFGAPYLWLIYLLPVAVVVWVVRVRTVVEPEALTVRRFVGSRRVPWSKIRSLHLRDKRGVRALLTDGSELPLRCVRVRDLPQLAAASGGHLTTATASATAAEAGLRIADSIRVGRRPNVTRVDGDNVFVGSFRDRVPIVDAKTGKLRDYAPKVGVGVTDGAFGYESCGSRSRARRRRPARREERPTEGPPPRPRPAARDRHVKDAVWVSLVARNGAPDMLLKLDPRTGQTLATVPYPYGITSLAASPTALWVVTRRRARVLRADPKTGKACARCAWARPAPRTASTTAARCGSPRPATTPSTRSSPPPAR